MIIYMQVLTPKFYRCGISSSDELERSISYGYRFSHMPFNGRGTNRWQQIQDEFLADISREPRRICSYCNKDQGPAGEGYKCDTHGICSDCYDQEMDIIRRMGNGFYDSDKPMSDVVNAIITEVSNETIC